MARNLLKAGFAVRGYDLSTTTVAVLAEEGAYAAASAADAARHADCVITMLPNGEHVEAALFGPDGVAASLRPGMTLIDMSTIAPAVTDRIAAVMAARGVAMVDAPVGRTSQHAVDGKLLIMVGGTPEALQAVRGVLETLGDTIVHCGPVGAGIRMKIVNNYMSITLNATTAEALSLAEASGLDPELARTVMLGTAAGLGHMATTYPAKVLRGDLTPGFKVDLAYKDLGLALDLAASVGLRALTGQAARTAYGTARTDGHGSDDWTALYANARSRLKQ